MIACLCYSFFSLVYGFFILWIWRGLRKIKLPWHGDKVHNVSIVIAARNEEQNIAYCLGTLLKQSHPRENLEIIVVDDHSEDRTRSLAENIAAKFPSIQVLSVPEPSGLVAPKKAALAAGIAQASGEIVLTLDADCGAPSLWVEKMSGLFAPDVSAAAAWVLLPEENNLAAQIEFIDAFSLQLIGAAAIGWNRPFLANGANFGFRRKSYHKNGGYDGFSHLGSGDDDLLLQKLDAQDHGRIVFNTDPEAAISTLPCKSWREFFQQRIRWSSKTAFYPNWIKWTEAVIFIYYAALLLSPVLAFLLPIPLWLPLLAMLFKFICDSLLLRHGVRKLRRSWHWPPFILASLLHLVYIPVIGILGLYGRYTWKGRQYRMGRLETSTVQNRH